MHTKRVLGTLFIVVLVVLAVFVPVVSATPADPALQSPGAPPTIPPPRPVKVRLMGTVIAIGNTWTIRTEAGDEHLDVNDKTRFVEAGGSPQKLYHLRLCLL